MTAVEGIKDKLLFPELQEDNVIWNSYVTCSVLVAYVSFTKWIGPMIMKDRKPFELKRIMIAYNAIMVASNAFLAANLMVFLFRGWHCRCEDVSFHLFQEERKTVVPMILAFFYIKFAELFDTVLFILRKKFNQVSFLHVFHHSVVFLMVWACFKHNLLKFNMVLMGAINSSVHVVLYLYYGLSVLGPSVKKYLWWKKYLTKIQIIQFFVLMLYVSFSTLTGCEKFNTFDRIMFTFIGIVTALFFNFYFKAYNKRK